jgi:carboxyl-terminal processing protease
MNSLYKTIILIAFCAFNSNLFAQNKQPDKQTKQLIKAITKTLKKESIVKEKIDWNRLDDNLKSIDFSGKHNSDREKVYSVFITALQNAGDHHSLFLSKAVSDWVNKVNKEEVLITSKYLGNNIGYLKIPFCMTFDAEKDLNFANTLIKQIRNLDENGIDKWIIDLRDNIGGNRWPMLAGLTPIIGDGLIGYNIVLNKHLPIIIKKGLINYSTIETNQYTTKRPFKKIAVIINEHTGSSGEMVAIALLGFEETKSFGQESGGYTTINSSRDYKDGTQLYLETGYSVDKNKKIYFPSIKPDFPLSNKLTEEEIIKSVENWLLKDK